MMGDPYDDMGPTPKALAEKIISPLNKWFALHHIIVLKKEHISKN